MLEIDSLTLISDDFVIPKKYQKLVKILPFVKDDQKYIFLINLWFFNFYQEFYTSTVNVKVISATSWGPKQDVFPAIDCQKSSSF